jgi:hypothetical protein
MTENFTGITLQSPSLFDQQAIVATTLLQLQTISSNPMINELPTATGMVLPDVATYDRLSHFPEDLYDLRAESHLVRFLKVLMGESGVGVLRKRYLLCQLEQALDSTHFYDLDRFYGALFGARRGILGALPVDPMESVCTPDGWDEVHEYDARFRERIIKLARAITLGGTPMGMQALAEALTQVECDVYEVWSILDSYGPAGLARTYGEVEIDFGTYGGMAPFTWAQIENNIKVGNLGLDARNEFVVRPKTVYNTSDPADARRRAEDLYGVHRVIHTLKPAFSIATIDDQGIAVHREVPIAGVWADSEFWEVVSRVLPDEGMDEIYRLLYTAYDKRAVPTGIQRVQPRPPFTASQGQQWSYTGEVTGVSSFSSVLANYNISVPPNLSSVNYDTVKYYDGKSISYRPEYALIDPRQALVSQTAGEGSVTAHPYSGVRKAVPTHG